jgi:hypothetical protein
MCQVAFGFIIIVIPWQYSESVSVSTRLLLRASLWNYSSDSISIANQVTAVLYTYLAWQSCCESLPSDWINLRTPVIAKELLQNEFLALPNTPMQLLGFVANKLTLK